MTIVVGEVSAIPLTALPAGSAGAGSDVTAAVAKRSEAGIGGMASWGGFLWFTTYPDENGNSVGNGLWRVGNDWVPVLVDATEGTHAGRQIHGDDLFIGQHVVRKDGTYARITGFNADDRITAWARVPSNNLIYALTMGGRIYSCPLNGTAVTYIGDAKAGLSVTGQAHFKAAWGVKNRLYVVTNRDAPHGRLGYYDVTAATFTRMDNVAPDMSTATADSDGASFVEVAGCYDGDGHAFAFGQNSHTGFMYVIAGNTTAHKHRRFLIPLCSQQQAYSWQQEWMRLRTVDTERFLLNFHGVWFQVSPFLQTPIGVASEGVDIAAAHPRIEPVARYIRTTTDFTIHNGKLVLGSNSSSTQLNNKYPNTGASQSTLVMLDSTDDLLRAGIRPSGSGYFFHGKTVATNEFSDLMLARGYEKKCIHLRNPTTADVTLDVLAYNNGNQSNNKIGTITATAGSYAYMVLPDAFNTDWLAVRAPAASVSAISCWATFS